MNLKICYDTKMQKGNKSSKTSSGIIRSSNVTTKTQKIKNSCFSVSARNPILQSKLKPCMNIATTTIIPSIISRKLNFNENVTSEQRSSYTRKPQPLSFSDFLVYHWDELTLKLFSSFSQTNKAQALLLGKNSHFCLRRTSLWPRIYKLTWVQNLNRSTILNAIKKL